LAELAEEINPFLSENFIDMVTILEDDDLRKEGQYDEKTLMEKYYESLDHIRSAQPKISSEMPSEMIRKSNAPADPIKKRKLTTAQLDVTAAKKRQEEERLEAIRSETERLFYEKKEAMRKEA